MRLLVATVIAVLAYAAPASAQVFQAIDDTGDNHRWEPTSLTVQVGDTVTWRYDGTQLAHNVLSKSPNWNPPLSTPASNSDPRPVTYTFTAEGVYDFVCFYHESTMRGTVTVGSPPPPPPPPLSEQHWANDQSPPRIVELADRARPRLTRVRVAAVRNGARVRFRLSERSRVSVRFRLAGVIVKATRRTVRAGRHSFLVRDRRMQGRYRVEVFARDLAGNRSPTKRASVRVR
jgi:plastocyanin